MRPGRSILSRLVLAVASGTLSILALEGAIRGLDLFADARAAGAGPEVTQPEGTQRHVTRGRIHPFLGWSIESPLDPSQRRHAQLGFLRSRPFFPDGQPTLWAEANTPLNLFGYRSYLDDYRSVSTEDYVVGIFGGSVAAQTSVFAGDWLQARLTERHPELSGRIQVLNLGGGGFKQPQQVNTLVEMALLGVPLDLVINLDGVNEVTFGAIDAQRHHRHPIFPSFKHLQTMVGFATGTASARSVELAAAIHDRRRKAEKLVALGSTHRLLRRSALGHAILGSMVLRFQDESLRLEAELQELSPDGKSDPESAPIPIASLPDPCLGTRDGCWPLIADLWMRGSVLMHEISRGLGAQYVHFLQPSQYPEGAKPLSREERERAYEAGSPFEANVRAGYPWLQERGKQLGATSVAFHDLTRVFSQRPETLYVDSCCHLNVNGYRLLVDAIVEAIPESSQPES